MKYLSIASSFVAYAATVAAQGPIQPCTYTSTACHALIATATVTDYELPGTTTVTQSFDCHGCQDIVTVNICRAPIPVPVTTVTVHAQETTTEDVCSSTPTV